MLEARYAASAVLAKFKGLLKSTGDEASHSKAAIAAVGLAGLVTAGAIGDFFAHGIKDAAHYQQAMEMSVTQAGRSQGMVNEASQKLLEMAPQVATSQNDLAESFYHAASASMPLKQSLQLVKIAAEGAKVGGSDLVDTTKALVALTKSGAVPVGQFGRAMGAVNAIVGAGDMTMSDLVEAFQSGVIPVMQTAGVSLNETGGALAYLADRGIPASRAARMLMMSVQLMENPSVKAAGALKQIGLSTTDLAADLQKPDGLVKAMQDLKDHLKDLSTIQKNQVIGDIFGGARSSPAIKIMLNNLEDLQHKTDLVNKGANKFGSDWVKTTQTAVFQAQSMHTAIGSVTTAIGMALLPAVQKLLAFMVPVIARVAEWTAKHKTLAAIILGSVAAVGLLAAAVAGLTFAFGALGVMASPVALAIGAIAVAAGAIALAVLAPKTMEKALERLGVSAKTAARVTRDLQETWVDLKKAAAVVWATIGPVVRAALKVIGDEVRVFTDLIHGHWSKAWSDLKKFAADELKLAQAAVKAGLAPIVAVFHALSGDIVKVWHQLFDLTRTAVTDIESWLRNAWQEIRSQAERYWLEVKNALIAIWNDIANAASSAWDGFTGLMNGIWQDVQNALTAAWNLISGDATRIWDAIVSFFNSIWDGLKDAWSTVWDGIKTALSTVWDGIKTAASNVWDALSAGASAVWDGLSTVWSTEWGAIKTAVSTVWDAIKSLASGVWGALSAGAGAVWDGLQTVWATFWNGMKSVMTTSWDSLKSLAGGVWDAMSSAAGDIWNGLQTVWSIFWSGMKSVITPIWDGLKSAAKTVWDAMTAAVNDIWDGMQTVWATFWNGMKSALTPIWTGLKTAAGAIWDAMSSAVNTIWDGLQTVWASFWSGMKTAMVPIWNAIEAAAKTVWDAMTAAAKGLWAGVQSIWTTDWDAIKSAVSTIWSSIKTVAGGVWSTLKSGAKGAWSGVKSIWVTAWDGIKSGVQAVWDDMAKAASQAWSDITAPFKNVASWVSGIVGDIKDPINNVIKAVDDISLPTGFAIETSKVLGVSVPSGVDLTWSHPFSIATLAAGGIVTGPTMALIGEAGPEAVIPLGSGGYGGGGGTSLTIDMRGATFLNSNQQQDVLNQISGHFARFVAPSSGLRMVSR